jgi:hypothetical protein
MHESDKTMDFLKAMDKEINKLISKDKGLKQPGIKDNAYLYKSKPIRLSVNSWQKLTEFMNKALLRTKSFHAYKTQLSKNKGNLLLEALNNLKLEASTLYHHLTKLHEYLDVEVQRIITSRILKKAIVISFYIGLSGMLELHC